MLKMYFTMLPLILAGIANMLFVKTKFYKRNKKPIDGGKCLKDNRRILGDNKTWIGFIGMTAFSTLFQIVFGIICNYYHLNHNCDTYLVYNNTITYNCIAGFCFGFLYVLCELPNSFFKRRLNIDAGQHGKGIVGFLFFLLDQFDSMFGVMFALCVLSGLNIYRYILYVLLGAITHIIINIILCVLGVRKRI